MDFSIDLESKIITDSKGNRYTIKEFRALIDFNGKNYKLPNMVQKFINYNYDFDRLINFYNAY